MNNNSIENILTFPLIPIELYQKIKDKIPKSVENTTDLINLFKFLEKSINSDDEDEKLISQLILFDFKYFINHPIVSKRKSTATTVEERIAFLTDGIITDSETRINPVISDLLSEDEINKLPLEVQRTICSNYREKGDVLIGVDYKLSVKSLMSNNLEINYGAFQFNTLFKEILDDDILRIGERRNQITKIVNGVEVELGRGSTPQLINLFSYIRSIGKWDDFIERWKISFKGVFQEDTIIYMKNPNYFEIYIINKDTFNELIINSLKNNYNNNQLILNRWEGNSIRMDRRKLIANANYSLKLEFSKLFNDDILIEKLEKINSLKSTILLE